MKVFFKTLSWIGLALSILPPFFLFAGVIERSTYLNLLIIGMLLWFGTAPFWIKSDSRT